MKYALALTLYILAALGLVWTDNLYQNNDEGQLIAASSEHEPDPQSVILHFKDPAPSKAQLEQKFDDLQLEYQLYGPEELTGKQTVADQIDFYNKHPQSMLKAKTNESTTYLLFLDPESKRNYPALFELLENQYKADHLRIAGLPYLNFAISEKTSHIKEYILPLLIILSLVLSLVFIRQLYTTLVMFSFPLLGISLSQVILKLMYGESNLLSTLTPLVAFVIVLSLSYHLYFGYKTYLSTEILLKKKLKPILFTILTTVIGVLSLAMSDIVAIKTFAFSAALAISVSTLVTIGLFLKLAGHFEQKTFKEIFKIPQYSFGKSLFWIFLIAPVLLATLFTRNLPTQIEALYFFKPTEKVVQDHNYIEAHVAKQPILKILLADFSVAKDYERLNEMESLEQELQNQTNQQVSVVSPLSVLKEINLAYTGQPQLPTEKLSALALLGKAPKELYGGVDRYQITMLAPTPESDEYQNFLESVRTILAKHQVQYQLAGTYYHLMNSQTSLLNTLMRSFLMSMISISILIGFMFKNLKKLIVFLLVNTAPPILTLISFRFLGLSLNLATIMTFSISFGLIVDSTIHIMYAQNLEQDAEKFSKSTLYPIVISTIILIVGFAIFTVHSFLPIWQFGASLALTLLYGFLYDYYVLPNE